MNYIFAIIALNLAFFFRTLRYGQAVDDWENARCGCKEPDYVKAKQTRNGKDVDVEICKKCHILKRIEPKNKLEKFLLSFGGIWWAKDAQGNKLVTTQYTDREFDHLITMGLHIINCILIYLAFGHNNISFLTAVLFSIHPMAMQGSSVWLSGKGYAAGLMFCLLAWWLKPLAPLFYGIGSWYVAVLVLPLVFLKTKFWFWIFLIPLGFYFRKKNLKDSIEFKYKMVSKTRNPMQWYNVILVPKTIGYYLSLCILPSRLGVHHTYLQMHGVTPWETKTSTSLKDKFFWIGIVAIFSTIYLFFFHWGNLAFGMMWFMIFIAPWSNWMGCVHQPVSERYGVISLVGALYALSNLIIGYPWIMAAAFTYYITVTNYFLPAYENILNYAWYNVHNFPDSFQGWLWKSDLERNFRLTERSFDSAMQAWILRPHDFMVNNNLATMLLQQRKYKEAEPFMNAMRTAELYSFELEGKRKEKMDAMDRQIAEDKARIKEYIKNNREIDI